MGLFSSIFGIFDKYKKPVKEFHAAYREIYELVSLLKDEIKALRKRQKELVEQLEIRGDHFTGHSSLMKTQVIHDEKTPEHHVEEGLIPELEKLAEESRKRFEIAEESFEKLIKPRADEELEIRDINDLLNQILNLLVDIKEVEKENTTKGKLGKIDICLREISDVLREFHHRKKYGLQKKILKDFDKIRLIRKVYNKSRPHIFCQNGHIVGQNAKECPVCKSKLKSILEFTLNKKEFGEFQEEAHFLNTHNDPNNRVIWNQFWRDRQVMGSDRTTGYTKLHLNTDIRLRGKQKKNIHLLVA
ncbi:hypothetical protein KY345_02390 [Candidatus Woesearchaeota archaeon]|nr:hypothetical protein [Candidatus Woesearchaeota archaeon]